MESKAVAKYVRIAPRKVRVVMDLIRGKNVAEAFAILKFTPKAGAEVVEKVLRSAVANAENNFDMDVEKLYVKTAFADQGPTLKRIHPRSRGQAFKILKRTSHVTTSLTRRTEQGGKRFGSESKSAWYSSWRRQDLGC